MYPCVFSLYPLRHNYRLIVDVAYNVCGGLTIVYHAFKQYSQETDNYFCLISSEANFDLM